MLDFKFFYFGGQFQFRYEDYSYDVISKDYRSLILQDPKKFINKPTKGFYHLSDNVLYVGPFYFYDNTYTTPPQDKVVTTESEAVGIATNCVFVLSNGSAPGTVTEIINATLKKKNVIIFYETNNSGDPIQNDLWYALVFAKQNNKNCILKECPTYQDAVNECLTYVNNIIND